MLQENSTPTRNKSALERRVAFGLDETPDPESETTVDVEEFMVNSDENVGDGEATEE